MMLSCNVGILFLMDCAFHRLTFMNLGLDWEGDVEQAEAFTDGKDFFLPARVPLRVAGLHAIPSAVIVL